MHTQETVVSGKPYLMDNSTGLVYKVTPAGNAPEIAGKWVQGRVVFTPPTTEVELYTEMAEYLKVGP